MKKMGIKLEANNKIDNKKNALIETSSTRMIIYFIFMKDL